MKRNTDKILVTFFGIMAFSANLCFPSVGKKGDIGLCSVNEHNDNWAFEKIDLYDAWNFSESVDGIRVVLLDTGVNLNYSGIYDVINQSLARSFYGTTSALYSDDDHGSQMAGIISGYLSDGDYGVIKNVEIIPVRIDFNNSTDDEIKDALEYSISLEPDFINISGIFHTDVKSIIADYDGLIFVAAGNEDYNISGTNSYIANYTNDNIVVVGGTNKSDERYYYNGKKSNYSLTNVDLFAPGYAIPIVTDTNYVFYGTSASTAICTGASCLYKYLNQDSSNIAIKNAMLSSVDTSTYLNSLCVSGGRLNVYNFLHNSNHYYNYNYVNINTTYHYSYCYCGAKVKRGHTVAGSSTTSSICLYCGGEVETGFIISNSLNTINMMDYYFILEKDGKYYINETKRINDILFVSYNDYLKGNYYE